MSGENESWRQVSEEDKKRFQEQADKQREAYVDSWMKNSLAGQFDPEYDETLIALNNLFLTNQEDIKSHLMSSNPAQRTWSDPKSNASISYDPDNGFTAINAESHPILEGFEFTPINKQTEITEAACAAGDGKKGHMIFVNGEAFMLNPKRIGFGENSGVFEGVDLLGSKDEIVAKVLVGRVDQKQGFIAPDSQSAQMEHQIGSMYNPVGDKALGIGVGTMEVPFDSPILLDVFDGDKKKLNDFIQAFEDSDGYRGGTSITIYVLVQRKVPGKELGKVDKPPQTPDEVTPEMVKQKLEVALAIIKAIDKFRSDTNCFHMDVRPENLLIEMDPNTNKPIVRFIDPGAAANYKMTSGGIGVTEGFSHPTIELLSEEGAVCNNERLKENGYDKGYGSEHEAYAVRAVMRFMGIDKMIDLLPEAERGQFAAVREMLREDNGTSNDMTLEGMSEEIGKALSAQVTSSKTANPQSPSPSPSPMISSAGPSTPHGEPSLRELANKEPEKKPSLVAQRIADLQRKIDKESEGGKPPKIPTPRKPPH